MWVTEIGPLTDRHPAGAAPPGRFERVGGTTVDEWRDAVGVALDAISRGEVDKVVLARDLTLRADAPLDVATVIRRLCEQQAGTYVYAHRGLVGTHGAAGLREPSAATEELLKNASCPAPEHLAEDILRVVESPSGLGASPGIKRIVAHLVVGRALLRIAEHLVRLPELLELFLSGLVARIFVRVVLNRKFPESFF